MPHLRVDRLVVQGSDNVPVLLRRPDLLELLVGLACLQHYILRRNLEFTDDLRRGSRLALLMEGLEEAHLRARLQRRVIHSGGNGYCCCCY